MTEFRVRLAREIRYWKRIRVSLQQNKEFGAAGVVTIQLYGLRDAARIAREIVRVKVDVAGECPVYCGC